jgi:hypothetical protein
MVGGNIEQDELRVARHVLVLAGPAVEQDLGLDVDDQAWLGVRGPTDAQQVRGQRVGA